MIFLLKLQAAFAKAVTQQKQYKLHFWRYKASLHVKEITITRAISAALSSFNFVNFILMSVPRLVCFELF